MKTSIIKGLVALNSSLLVIVLIGINQATAQSMKYPTLIQFFKLCAKPLVTEVFVYNSDQIGFDDLNFVCKKIFNDILL